jgi:hypothetical protein
MMLEKNEDGPGGYAGAVVPPDGMAHHTTAGGGTSVSAACA